MIRINAVGEPCPIPVVKTLNALKELKGTGVVETLVDNEIAVENLTKLASNKGYGLKVEKLAINEFKVTINTNEKDVISTIPPISNSQNNITERNIVVVISSDKMGEGKDELGKVLIKSFIYALSQQELLPKTILFYNGGAMFSCEDSPSLEDLTSMEIKGVEILTCGTCLDYYGLSNKLKVGQVTNMYTIVGKMAEADLIIKP